MTTQRTRTSGQARAVAALALPGLIRLVSEIDDNGPISRGSLQSTLTDFTRHQIRYAIEAGRDLGVLRSGHHGRPCYLLTEAGAALADVYDEAARWARTHAFPQATSDFVTRVRQTLALLGQTTAPAIRPGSDCNPSLLAQGLRSSATALEGLESPRRALADWIDEHLPHTTDTARRCSSTAAAEVELAA